MNLPMVLVNALPGQERANAQHLEEQGCAVWTRKNELADTVDGLLKNEDKLKQMALACGNDKKDSALEIVQILDHMLESNTNRNRYLQFKERGYLFDYNENVEICISS